APLGPVIPRVRSRAPRPAPPFERCPGLQAHPAPRPPLRIRPHHPLVHPAQLPPPTPRPLPIPRRRPPPRPVAHLAHHRSPRRALRLRPSRQRGKEHPDEVPAKDAADRMSDDPLTPSPPHPLTPSPPPPPPPPPPSPPPP